MQSTGNMETSSLVVLPSNVPSTQHYMAVASGRAGWVLARRPLFHRLTVHMQILNTCKVVRIRTNNPNRLRKQVPIMKISLT